MILANIAMNGLGKREEQKRFLEIVTDLYSNVLFPAVDNLAQCTFHSLI